MISEATLRRIYRASAVYDLALSAPFALPWGVDLTWSLLTRLSPALGLPAPAPLDPHATLFAGFFGSIVTLWSLLRLHLNEPRLARWDAAGRLSFSLAMATAIGRGASPLLWPLLALELGWAVLQLLPVKK